MKHPETSDDTIPAELTLLANTARIATATVTSRTREERSEGISAIAILYGAEPELRGYLADKTTRPLAAQILTALHPGENDFVPTIRIPWDKRMTREIILPLTEKAIPTAVRFLRSEHKVAFAREAIGCGKVLNEAAANGFDFGKRGTFLRECCRKLENACRNGDYEADIGYVPAPDRDENQMKFAFYKPTA